jgi:hypothetical protein
MSEWWGCLSDWSALSRASRSKDLRHAGSRNTLSACRVCAILNCPLVNQPTPFGSHGFGSRPETHLYGVRLAAR